MSSNIERLAAKKRNEYVDLILLSLASNRSLFIKSNSSIEPNIISLSLSLASTRHVLWPEDPSHVKRNPANGKSTDLRLETLVKAIFVHHQTALCTLALHFQTHVVGIPFRRKFIVVRLWLTISRTVTNTLRITFLLCRSRITLYRHAMRACVLASPWSRTTSWPTHGFNWIVYHQAEQKKDIASR